jgi:F-type H+-transporting ATPase subunit b
LELNWTTFVLEIVNFLVLVWILKRFLYKPVQDVIARRRSGIEKALADAEALQAEAESLHERYERRLADWGRERQQAREALVQEIETERARKTAALQSLLDQEREKANVIEARRQIDALRKIEETALMQGARFAALLLKHASGPDTEARLVELVITELTRLPVERFEDLRNSYGKSPEAIVVVSAFPLPDDQRERLAQALAPVISQKIPLQFEQDSELLAGLRITFGARVLGVNLLDELKGFTELAPDE